MDILFDNIIFSKEKQGGISNYWFHLIKSYEANNNAFYYEENQAGENIFRKQLMLTNKVRHTKLPLVLARLLPIKYEPASNGLLYHSSFYRKLITRSKVLEVTTIHDFLHNKYSTLVKKTLHNKLKYAAIKRSAGIICVSEHTIKDLKKYCPPKKEQKIALIHNGVSDDFYPIKRTDPLLAIFLKRLGINDKFILFVGARSSYKNFDFVVRIMKHVADYKLVVVGNILTSAEKKMIGTRLKDRIIVASNIPNKELNFLYNTAHALLYPSSYEGFGIPVVEGMKAGCPILALDKTSIPEVAGDAAKLFDSLDIYRFVQEISQLENNDYRMEIIERGLKNAGRFSWIKCVNETREFYKEIQS